MTAKQKAANVSIERLKEILEEGDTVDCVLRHVSRSGEMKRIDFFVSKIREFDGKPEIIRYYLTAHIAKALGYSLSSVKDGIAVKSCGEDTGLAVIYDLSWVMFGNEYKFKHSWL